MDELIKEPWDNKAYRTLREGKTEIFNELIGENTDLDLRDCNLSGVDLRKVNLNRVHLSGALMKNVDLRDVDLRKHNLCGASIQGAKITGTFFPDNISATEILMSLEHGTRLRVLYAHNED